MDVQIDGGIDIQLVHREENKVYEIYGVSRDLNGYPCFLIYQTGTEQKHKGSWRYVSAKHFVPIGYGINDSSKGDILKDIYKHNSASTYKYIGVSKVNANGYFHETERP